MRLKTHMATAVAALTALGGISVGGGIAAAAPLPTPPQPIAPHPALALGSSSPGGDFYTPPAVVPRTPGAVLKSVSTPLLLQIPGLTGQWPGDAKTVMYSSTLQDGAPTAVTGTLIEPSAAWTGRGERPTIVLAPGTIGQGDQCAPSKLMTFPASVDLSKPSLGVNYEAVFAYALLQSGYRVMMTDYIGLGTPGIHTYVNRVEEGHAVLDAARAAITLSGAKASDPVGFWGYSQGGGAAASAAEMAATYAPELHVKGTYAGAPPADLAKTVSGIDGTFIAGAIGYAINGLEARYPQIAPIIDREVNARGRAALKTVSTQCIVDTALTFGFQHTQSWTRSGTSLAAIIAANPEIKRVVDEQRIGRLKPNAPVLVTTGVNDDVVPHGQVLQPVKDWRAQGADVTLINDQTPPIFPGLVVNHVLPDLFTSIPAWNWLNAHFR
uniref:lipase family protein n=1 Tax=Gordonia jinhuaensis TaxID=1517702 RepID=UPI001E4B94DA|nr:lipase family protein [Gordonia jinhuaensis]